MATSVAITDKNVDGVVKRQRKMSMVVKLFWWKIQHGRVRDKKLLFAKKCNLGSIIWNIYQRAIKWSRPWLSHRLFIRWNIGLTRNEFTKPMFIHWSSWDIDLRPLQWTTFHVSWNPSITGTFNTIRLHSILTCFMSYLNYWKRPHYTLAMPIIPAQDEGGVDLQC